MSFLGDSIPLTEYGPKGTANPRYAGYRYDDIEKVLTPDQFKSFASFMYGQTVAAGDNGEAIVYPHDFERWVNQGMRAAQSPHDWD